MRRAKGWVVSRCRSGVASTANPLPLPSISSVLWQQASPSKFTPSAESFLGDGPCVVLSMISRSASPRRGDSGSMLLRTQPCGGGVGSYLGSSDEGRAAQPSRARSVGGVVRLLLFLVDRCGLGPPACVRRAREGIRSLRGNWGDTRATRGQFWRAFGRGGDGVDGAATGRGAFRGSARRAAAGTPYA